MSSFDDRHKNQLRQLLAATKEIGRQLMEKGRNLTEAGQSAIDLASDVERLASENPELVLRIQPLTNEGFREFNIIARHQLEHITEDLTLIRVLQSTTTATSVTASAIVITELGSSIATSPALELMNMHWSRSVDVRRVLEWRAAIQGVSDAPIPHPIDPRDGGVCWTSQKTFSPTYVNSLALETKAASGQGTRLEQAGVWGPRPPSKNFALSTVAPTRAPAASTASRGDVMRRSPLRLTCYSNRQNSHSRFRFVDHNKCASSQVSRVPRQGRHDSRCQMIGQYILPANLQHARSRRMCQRKHCPKIEIVREHDMTLASSPLHNGAIRCFWVADCAPMGRNPTVICQGADPIRRQIHINQNLQTHAPISGSSRSSIRHAA